MKKEKEFESIAVIILGVVLFAWGFLSLVGGRGYVPIPYAHKLIEISIKDYFIFWIILTPLSLICGIYLLANQLRKKQ